ncbi:ZrgA family zinc uptake protein [Ferrimonas lipolytica]|uniref:DUF2796 domain-containing protein n=1 Tax=Ferrimonas lipolytica TaxID=2724191 RepID=A0A6H1UDA6_9GAMM|nr:DUF2796 domain-containing protein [Ferrimonas lipolytica]QIZ76196.1 DUF2796 domain-containing protein [Ferrimonas lipolytica]
MNQKRTLALSLIVLSCSCLSSGVLAQSGAHQHGIAHLNLVQQEGLIEVEVESPLANLVGFEHQPETKQQRQAYATAIKSFEATAQFSFNGANCKLVEQQLELPFEVADAAQLEHHHAHEEHSHEHHGEKHHDEELHHGEHHHDHSNLEARYQYSCDGVVTSVKVALFELMPQLETIKSQWFSQQAQGSTNLSKEAAVLNLK